MGYLRSRKILPVILNPHCLVEPGALACAALVLNPKKLCGLFRSKGSMQATAATESQFEPNPNAAGARIGPSVRNDNSNRCANTDE
jgi:hypothetical protein